MINIFLAGRAARLHHVIDDLKVIIHIQANFLNNFFNQETF